MGDGLQAFKRQDYLNIETFRKNGEGVKTPVWFVEIGGVLYIRTGAQSGKVSRICRDGRVRVAPCDRRGELAGEWYEARAEVAPASDKRMVLKLLRGKYKLLDTFFAAATRLGKMEDVIIKVTLVNN